VPDVDGVSSRAGRTVQRAIVQWHGMGEGTKFTAVSSSPSLCTVAACLFPSCRDIKLENTLLQASSLPDKLPLFLNINTVFLSLSDGIAATPMGPLQSPFFSIACSSCSITAIGE
jgi:hypothetical protein